jgi:hypothetical protein
MRIVRLLLVVAVALTCLAYPLRTTALPQFSYDIYYWECGSQLPDGEEHHGCNGSHQYSGNRNPTSCGAMKQVIRTDCDTAEVDVTFYTKNGCGDWYEIPPPEEFECACGC